MTLINSAANENIKRWRKISEHPRGAKKIGTTLAEGIHLAEVICEKRPETRAVVVRETTSIRMSMRLPSAWPRKRGPNF